MRIFRRLLPLVFAPLLLLAPATGRAAVDVAVSITVAPPVLPVYVQPVIPAEGYIWMPGYWAWGPYGYYWVPGTWVLPPRVGLLWTPGYWGWVDGLYVWHVGYWGPHIGFYGGVNYGFGYIGVGYAGGFWDHDHFHYNQAVNNFGGTHITNVYNKTVINNVNITNNTNISRVSYNGGQGGLTARPNAAEESVAHDQHVPPTDLQTHHEQMASNNTALRSSVNHGHPSIAATPHPAAFTERGVVSARGANNGAPRNGSPNGTGNGNGVHPAAATPDAAHPQKHPSAQNGATPPQGGPPHQGNAHVAAAGNSQRPPQHPQGQPGGHPQGGPQHPVNAAAAHPAGGPPNDGPHEAHKPAEQPGPQPGGEPHPDNHGEGNH